MSIAVDGMGAVFDGEAHKTLESVAESTGLTLDALYTVVYFDKPKKKQQLKLKVGNQGLQLFDESGTKLLDSWQYFKMEYVNTRIVICR